MARPVVLSFVFGALVGAICGVVLVTRHYNRLFEGWYLTGVVEQARIGQQIEAGEGDALAARIASELPAYATAVSEQFGTTDRSLPALWTIRDYYLETAKPVPEGVAALLESLPPKPPGCCVVAKPRLD